MTPPEASPGAAEIWGAAPFERIVETLAPVHEALVERLEPGPGQDVLDVGTGTGAVALRAAAAGARVTGIDIAPVLIETARRIAEDRRLEIRFDVGDAAQLPYADASFDAVGSSFAVIFAPDHEAAASELARVTRPGGRLVVTSWAPNPGWDGVMRDYRPAMQAGIGSAADWGDEAYIRARLGDAFDLDVEQRVHHYEAESGQAAWELTIQSCGPMKTLVEGLDPDRRSSLRAAYIAHQEQFAVDGGVRVPEPYLLTIGRRT